MTGNAQHRPETVLRELLPMIDDRLHEAAPWLAVGAQFPLLIGKIALEHHGGAIVERVRQGRFAVDPLEPIVRQAEAR